MLSATRTAAGGGERNVITTSWEPTDVGNAACVASRSATRALPSAKTTSELHDTERGRQLHTRPQAAASAQGECFDPVVDHDGRAGDDFEARAVDGHDFQHDHAEHLAEARAVADRGLARLDVRMAMPFGSTLTSNVETPGLVVLSTSNEPSSPMSTRPVQAAAAPLSARAATQTDTTIFTRVVWRALTRRRCHGCRTATTRRTDVAAVADLGEDRIDVVAVAHCRARNRTVVLGCQIGPGVRSVWTGTVLR
jgi:hypothetical protein